MDTPLHPISGIDHVALTVRDLDSTCAFYARVFSTTVQIDYAPNGKSLVRQIRLGGAMLSLHQEGNGIRLVARRPTIGSADICFRWRNSIDSAVALLGEHGVPIIAGPDARLTAQGAPAKSIYFRDPDDNLIELMASDEACR